MKESREASRLKTQWYGDPFLHFRTKKRNLRTSGELSFLSPIVPGTNDSWADTRTECGVAVKVLRGVLIRSERKHYPRPHELKVLLV